VFKLEGVEASSSFMLIWKLQPWHDLFKPPYYPPSYHSVS